jgi:hypothetical protein
MPEYELSLDPSKKQPKVDVKKSAKKAAENEAKRLQSMRDNPRDTSKDFKFKYDRNNQDHKALLGHLMNNGLADDIVVDDRGITSIPRGMSIEPSGPKSDILMPLMKRIQAGGVAANLAARKSEKTAPVGTRPTAPGMRPPAPLPPRGVAKKESNPLIEDKAEVMRNLFGK